LAAVALVIVTLMGLWAIDISVSAMVVNEHMGENNLPGGYILTNGHRDTEPVRMYHYGIWAVIIAMFLMILILLHVVIAYFRLKVEKQIIK